MLTFQYLNILSIFKKICDLQLDRKYLSLNDTEIHQISTETTLEGKNISVLVAEFKFGPDSLVNQMKCLVIQFNSKKHAIHSLYYLLSIMLI